MTLIDKAEALATLRKHANGKTVLGGQVYQSLTLETALEAIAALPARGVGVPTEEDREWIDARADELFRANERIRGSVRPSTIRPQDFRDYFVVNATLERFAALPARGVGVKPLVWFEAELPSRGGGKYTADGYTLRRIEGLWLLDFAGNGKTAWRWVDLEAAKAAAQADYEARIFAALAPTDANHE